MIVFIFENRSYIICKSYANNTVIKKKKITNVKITYIICRSYATFRVFFFLLFSCSYSGLVGCISISWWMSVGRAMSCFVPN